MPSSSSHFASHFPALDIFLSLEMFSRPISARLCSDMVNSPCIKKNCFLEWQRGVNLSVDARHTVEGGEPNAYKQPRLLSVVMLA